MAKNLESLIECPFYIDYGSNFICCEGLCATYKTTHSFKNKAARTEHVVNVCSQSGGKKCPHYRAVSLLYERGLRH